MEPADRARLLALARATVESTVRGQAPPPCADPSPAHLASGAAFVTLRSDGALRGCIGHVEASQPLWESVRNMAQAAAERDPRFPPLLPEDLPGLEIEISVLSPLELVEPAQIDVGRHGLYLKGPAGSGLLLPQVAVEAGWSREEFLRRTWEKAELPPGTPGVRLYAFTVDAFRGR